MKIYCEECDGLGYEEIPDYDWDESLLETGMRYKCSECNGNGYVEKDTLTNAINEMIVDAKEKGWSSKGVSDKWHTFDELYYHRMILFLSLQLAHKDKSWKSKQHHDGTMFEDSFIVGINTKDGQYSYHYNLEFWDMFKDIKELERAPVFDGHKPEDITRLLSL